MNGMGAGSSDELETAAGREKPLNGWKETLDVAAG
jgi:hypothetical protein